MDPHDISLRFDRPSRLASRLAGFTRIRPDGKRAHKSAGIMLSSSVSAFSKKLPQKRKPARPQQGVEHAPARRQRQPRRVTLQGGSGAEGGRILGGPWWRGEGPAAPPGIPTREREGDCREKQTASEQQRPCKDTSRAMPHRPRGRQPVRQMMH